MISKNLASVSRLYDLSLPEIVTTRNGVQFDPRESKWAYRDGSEACSFNFNLIDSVSEKFILNLKLVLIWYIENKSPSYAANMFYFMKHFLEFIAKYRIIEEISSLDIINYRSSLCNNSQWRVTYISVLIKQWYKLRIDGINKDTIELLNQLRLKGAVKGEAVLTFDPFMGPFTDIELNGLYGALNMSYANNEIELSDYLLCLLVLVLGQRPVQYSYLKVCDVQVVQREDGSKIFMLYVPRVKQREEKPRSTFKVRNLIPQIGDLLVEYANLVEENFVGRLRDPKQAPLFPDRRGQSAYSDGLLYHWSSGSIKSRIRLIYDKLNVFSERTGAPLHIAPIRFRRTFGTQAAAEGHSPLVIAELLDHSDIQNVGVYVAATPEIIERIDRTIAERLAPLAQAFSGVLVDGTSEFPFSSNPKIIAPNYTSNFQPVGSCGHYGFCAFAAPIACYTCSSFMAWLDGPHSQILDFLLAERDRLMKVDVRIASVNDRTILAVAQIVKMCSDALEKQYKDD